MPALSPNSKVKGPLVSWRIGTRANIKSNAKWKMKLTSQEGSLRLCCCCSARCSPAVSGGSWPRRLQSRSPRRFGLAGASVKSSFGALTAGADLVTGGADLVTGGGAI